MFLQKSVKNDAMRTDPHEIYNGRVFLVTMAVCIECSSASTLANESRHAVEACSSEWTWEPLEACLPCHPSKSKIYGIYHGPGLNGEREFDLLGKSPKARANLSSNIVLVIQTGAFAGALISSWLANNIGRRWALILAAVLVFIGVPL
jgi:hypothetical protein